MGLSGRISTMLLVFMLLSGVLVGSWLFWGNTLRDTGQASARLLEDTIRLAVQDARSRLRAAVDHPAAMGVACQGVTQADVCLAMTVEGETIGELLTQGKALQPAVSQAQPQGFGSAMLRQIPAGSAGGAGVVYWQQQPLWVEYRVDGGTLRLAGVVLERLLNQWSTDMRMGMNWRWRTPEDQELPWGMANVQLQAVSGSAIELLVTSSMLTPALVGNWSGITVVILAGALTVISWLLFYRPVWRRLDNLLYQLRGILSQRDYSGRVNLGGHDEIAELGQHCNGLLSALEYSHSLMAKTNVVTTELLNKLGRSGEGVASDWHEQEDLWRDSMDIATRFSAALADNQLVMHYQPVVAMDTGTLVGWEALCRWEHPTRGLLKPAEFLQVAEQSGQMPGLLRWALARVCRDLPKLPHSQARVSVNLTHGQLLDERLILIIESTLQQFGLEPEVLEVELKEASLLKDFEQVTAQIESLRALGVGVCVDGYGFGAHSLTYLQRLPVTRLKLSRVFSERIALEHREVAFVEGIARFAAGLGATVVATCIENQQQVLALRSTRGIAAQGYAIASPMTLDEAHAWRAALAEL
jgi:EAL domain-containing protein (putative c-di-GMP-specific phosphodiesterase class I)